MIGLQSKILNTSTLHTTRLTDSTALLQQLIGAPILGRWSDNYGRKKILLLSNAGTLAGWFSYCIVFTQRKYF
jgi:MFS family permease